MLNSVLSKLVLAGYSVEFDPREGSSGIICSIRGAILYSQGEHSEDAETAFAFALDRVIYPELKAIINAAIKS